MQQTALILNAQQQQQQLRLLARKWRERKLLDFKQLDTFHRSINGSVFLGQLLGLLPLTNTLQPNPERVKFSLQSISILFTVHFLCCGTIKALHYTGEQLLNGITSKNIMGLFFFYANITICVCFLLLARNWSQLIRIWTRVELRFLMPPYRDVYKCMPLHRKLPLFSAIFLSIAIVEHSLFYFSEFINFRMKITHCSANQTHSNTIVHLFIKSKYADIFTVLPYNAFTIFYSFFLNANFNLIWNFSDLFIMLVSMALARRFQQYAAYVQMLEERTKHVPIQVWHDARQDHVQLCELLEYVDDKISHFVLISALNNTYFICNALLNIFTKLRWTVNYVYFWFSLLFLLGRTSSVFLCASTIHEAGRMPLQTLYLVSNNHWNEETERLAAQITSENISLTGKRFFNVTRKNLFGLMTCIVTWELMLLQLDAPNWQQGLPDLCT